MVVDRIRFFASHPRVLMEDAAKVGLLSWIPDRMYLSIMYRLSFGRKLNLEQPKRFTEKLQWLKLHDRKSVYTRMADKAEMKQYVAECIGEGHTAKLYGIWDSFEQIDFDTLPEQFALKTTHDSGGVLLCSDKASLDADAVRSFFHNHLHADYFATNREWPYKDIRPRVFAEELLRSEGPDVLTDYKFFCFNGEPKLMYISKDGAQAATTDFFDMDFKSVPLHMKDPPSEIPPERPALFEQMRNAAQAIASRDNTRHLRVDFYCVNGNYYVGELTFFHMAGFQPITPEDWDYTLGSWISLPTDCKE